MGSDSRVHYFILKMIYYNIGLDQVRTFLGRGEKWVKVLYMHSRVKNELNLKRSLTVKDMYVF